tara:strand:- start:34 stop:180 length:147 start_codon:yes stop_codon:yes gene_type:complete
MKKLKIRKGCEMWGIALLKENMKFDEKYAHLSKKEKNRIIKGLINEIH